MKENLLSNILIKPNVISKEGLDYILNHVKSKKRTDLSVFDPDETNKKHETTFTVDKKVRDTQLVDIEDIMPEIVDLYKDIVTNVINPAYEFQIKDSETPQLLSYSSGGHYMAHCDGQSLWKAPTGEVFWRKSTDRDISTVLFLNDDFEGGDFVFPELKVRIRPEPGMLVCFPSNSNYLHAVENVTKGERLSMVNWMTIKGFPTLKEETEAINQKYGIKE